MVGPGIRQVTTQTGKLDGVAGAPWRTTRGLPGTYHEGVLASYKKNTSQATKHRVTHGAVVSVNFVAPIDFVESRNWQTGAGVGRNLFVQPHGTFDIFANHAQQFALMGYGVTFFVPFCRSLACKMLLKDYHSRRFREVEFVGFEGTRDAPLLAMRACKYLFTMLLGSEYYAAWFSGSNATRGLGHSPAIFYCAQDLKS